jgi:hypothetical protein
VLASGVQVVAILGPFSEKGSSSIFWDKNETLDPIGSMYGIYANIWGILMVNVTIYRIHGSYGDRRLGNLEMFQDWMHRKNFGYLVEFAGKCPSFIKVYWSWESTFNMRVFVG